MQFEVGIELLWNLMVVLLAGGDRIPIRSCALSNLRVMTCNKVAEQYRERSPHRKSGFIWHHVIEGATKSQHPDFFLQDSVVSLVSCRRRPPQIAERHHGSDMTSRRHCPHFLWASRARESITEIQV